MDQCTLRDSLLRDGSTQNPTPTGFGPKVIQSDDLELKGIELKRNLGTDPYQTPERILRDHHQNLITEGTEEIGKVGVDMPYVQSRIHSGHDSAESMADSDLEDGKLRKMLASPPYVHGRGKNYGSFHRPTASGKPEEEVIQKRGARAQRTQADHSRRESLMSNSSQEPRANGKPDAVFSSRSDELGNQFESSILKFADPSKFGRSLLEGKKDHLLNQA